MALEPLSPMKSTVPASDISAMAQGGAKYDSKPRRRVVTGARREQNRVAQKAYRQRQREIRQASRKEVKSRREPPLQPRPAGSSRLATSAEALQDKGHLAPLLAAESLFPCEIESSLSSDQDDPSPMVPEDGTLSDVPISEAASSSSSLTSPSMSRTYSSTIIPSLGLTTMALFSAALQNALCLGFDLNELATCGPDYMSPLYRPEMTPRSDPTAIRASLSGPGVPSSQALALTSNSGRMPEHLAPTFIQMTIPHHASFDLIPIPLLRDRAIVLSITMPHRFNIHELKLDIYERGGLTVWQQSSTHPFRHDREVNGCPPWDMSSWEAAPWFIEKWCMVVGGKDGDLSQQSLMWQAFRAAINTQ